MKRQTKRLSNGNGNGNGNMQACGLILAAGGGLNIGREGPYTHLGGMVSYQLIRNVPFFHDILKKETVLRQVRPEGNCCVVGSILRFS